MNRLLTAACAAALLVPLSACSLTQSNKPAAKGGQGTINVDSSADKCDLTTTKAPSGNVVFKVKNTGNEVTEFYLYGEDGMRIVGEIENIGPGLSRDLVVRTAPGKYVTACKPGMKGQGIRDAFTVTDSGKDTKIKGVDQASDRRRRPRSTRPTSRTSRRSSSTRPPSSRRSTRTATTTRPARCSRSRAATGSASRPSPSPSVTSTRGWTCARPTSRRARSGPAGTGSRRTCGRRPAATRR